MTIYRGSTVPGVGSTARGNASDIDIEDAGGIITATDVEGALQEIQTALDVEEAALVTHMADTTTHGTTGDIVGTSDTQTLTNKTITSPDINGGTADALTSLTVAAANSSNVSRYVLSTTTATATQYAKLLTLAYPATNNVAANITLLLTPKSASGQYSPVIATVTALQGTTGLSTSSKIEVVHSDRKSVDYNDLFLDTATATNGTAVDLWMQSIIAAAYDVQVIAESFDTGVSVSSYNEGATWTASAPAGAVTVTSSWYGIDSTFTPVVEGQTTAGVGTYSGQFGYYTERNGYIDFILQTWWTAHTGTGNMIITGLPKASAGAIETSVAMGYSNISAAYPTGRIPNGVSYIEILDGAANETISATGFLSISGRYKV